VPTPGVADALVLRQSLRRQLPTLAAITALLGGYLVLGASGVLSAWLTWPGVVVFAVVLAIGLVGSLRGRRGPGELRLDAAGVTVREAPLRPWSDIAEVRVSGLRPGLVFPFSLGYRMVTFVPRPGVVLAPLPSARLRGAAESFAATRRDRWYGSQLIVATWAFDAPVEELLDAVRRFGDVPVRTV
jgi:hypothetical protein